MELIFACPHCRQQLEADSTLSGSSINCPACGVAMVIPEPDPMNTKTVNPTAASAAAKEEKHFQVPVTEGPTASLIKKPAAPLAAAAKAASEKQLRVKVIRRTDCVEVGKDHFEEVVTRCLGEIGEANVVSINTLNYTHVDMGSRQILSDYGVLITYRG